MPERTSTLIRLDKSLLEDLRNCAFKEDRSLNKQIEFILKQYINSQKK
ncbi:MAG: hypothetical protein N4R58_03345 [Lactobacillus iners]|nr:hypothetical protein [Lactobacillus iners]